MDQDKPVFAPLPEAQYSVIYADPPWDYKGQSQHSGSGNNLTGGATSHYETVTLEDLKELPVLSIAKLNCLLFMWTSSPHLDQAIELGKCWGFDYKTVAFVWDKVRVNPGYYTMSQCEIVLVFKRHGGKIPSPRGSRNERQYIRQARTSHSEKPPQVRESITRMFPRHDKIELFARHCVDGWDSWGMGVE